MRRIISGSILGILLLLLVGAWLQRNSRLQRAVAGSRPGAVDFWLRIGANPNWRAPSGQALLHIALDRRADSVAQRLLAGGADPNAFDQYGISAFEYALVVGKPETIELMKQRGANAEIVKPDGLRALESAAYWGYAGFVEKLAVNGANVNAVSVRGLTPLGLAVEGIAHPTQKGRALSAFTYEGTVIALVQAGADPNSSGPGKSVPLVALFQGQSWGGKMRWDVVHPAAALMARGADANARDREGDTVLQLALLANAPDEMIERLLNQFADPKLKNRQGQTAVDYATAAKRSSTVALLGQYADTDRAAAIVSYWPMDPRLLEPDPKQIFEIQLRDGSVTQVSGVQFRRIENSGGGFFGKLTGRRAQHEDRLTYAAKVGPIEFSLPVAIVSELTAARDNEQQLKGYSAVLANGSVIGFDSFQATTVSGSTRIAGQTAAFSANLVDLVNLRRIGTP